MRAAAAVTPRSLVGGPSLTKAGLVLGGGLALVLVAGALGLALGSVGVGLGDTVAILGHRLLGVPAQVTWSVPAQQIILEVRLPRVLTAMLVGGGLAVAGATFQATTVPSRMTPMATSRPVVWPRRDSCRLSCAREAF